MSGRKYHRGEFLWGRLEAALDAECARRRVGRGVTAGGMLRLKSALNDVNNILTLETTLAFVKWVYLPATLKKFPAGHRPAARERGRVCTSINRIKANSNGFDVEIPFLLSPDDLDVFPSRLNLIAEVKCNNPAKALAKGMVYDSQQAGGIRGDILHLRGGKGSAVRAKKGKVGGYYKFMVFVDEPDIRMATGHFLSALRKAKDAGVRRMARDVLYAEDVEEFRTGRFVYVCFVRF